MKTCFTSLFILLFCCARSQSYYYYNDIIATAETNQTMKMFVKNKVRVATATGFTPNGSRATDFSETKEVKENGKALKASTIVSLDQNIIYHRFDDKGRLASVSDSSAGVLELTTYTYNEDGRISRIVSRMKDDAKESDDIDIHLWFYKADGKPDKMWRVKNGNDSLEVRFVPEENGNTGEEVSYRKGKETDHVYYYYDEKNRLTDIVRFNKQAGKLLPEIILSYDDKDNVIQKVVSSDGDNYGLRNQGRVLYVRYIIWRYVFNKEGLKTKEALFNKDQEMTGKIEYTYSYN